MNDVLLIILELEIDAMPPDRTFIDEEELLAGFIRIVESKISSHPVAVIVRLPATLIVVLSNLTCVSTYPDI